MGHMLRGMDNQCAVKRLSEQERCDLNQQVGTLLQYQEGSWLVDLPATEKRPAEKVWIELKNLKPP